jgi:hypothetical protein
LSHPYIGKWKYEGKDIENPEYGPGKHNIEIVFEAKADGVCVIDFTMDGYHPASEPTPYFIFNNVFYFYGVGQDFFNTATVRLNSENNIFYLSEEGSDSEMEFTKIQ